MSSQNKTSGLGQFSLGCNSGSAIIAGGLELQHTATSWLTKIEVMLGVILSDWALLVTRIVCYFKSA